MAPDILSLAFVLIAVVVAALAFYVGIAKVARCGHAFKHACREIREAHGVQADNLWLVVRQNNRFFDYPLLDQEFDRYRKDVENARAKGEPVLPDVESYLGATAVSVLTWRGLVLQVPGVLTGIGVLGTFMGLIIGVGGVGFSSVAVAINGVEALLMGIKIAFYTSIAGLILSILFNIAYRFAWNAMCRNLDRFVMDFQLSVIPSTEVQDVRAQAAFRDRVVALLQARD